MKSIIYSIQDPERGEAIGIGSAQYLKDLIRDTNSQIIRYFDFEHTEDGREYMMNLEHDELYYLLNKKKNKKPLYVLHPN